MCSVYLSHDYNHDCIGQVSLYLYTVPTTLIMTGQKLAAAVTLKLSHKQPLCMSACPQPSWWGNVGMWALSALTAISPSERGALCPPMPSLASVQGPASSFPASQIESCPLTPHCTSRVFNISSFMCLCPLGVWHPAGVFWTDERSLPPSHREQRDPSFSTHSTVPQFYKWFILCKHKVYELRNRKMLIQSLSCLVFYRF